ncbi:MAG TPA: response regulator transcription factor [Bacillota bacterium]|nr:response regulator transcription factor [Bacillota bacterium]HQC36044.1 response regulator transcription factor [Bacillota bacterium]
MVNVLIVEDKKMPRDCMEGYIKSSERYRLAASITNAGMAEMTCMRYDIDLILMDVCTEEGESGIEACAVIKRQFPDIKIIIVTSMADSSFISKAREADADSFWYKEVSEHELLDIMDRTVAGESVWPDKSPDVQIGNAVSCEFTQGELEVLRFLVKGLPDSAIAESLHISVPAVRWHINQLFEKTGYNNRVSLACDVINKDLIVPGF